MLKTKPSLTIGSRRFGIADWGWVHFFLITQFVLQILLLFPQFGVLRAPMRMVAFGMSLIFLVWLPGPGVKHPAKGAALAILGILLVQLFFNPNFSSFPGALAQCALYLAILGPLFWVSRLNISIKDFEWLIYLLWGFHTLSSFFGVLQSYFPGQFQPFLSTAIQNQAYGGENLKITLTNGLMIYRPMGLTDTPGGAARSGFYALIFGIGIALQSRNPVLRIAGIGSSAIGLFCIYLSQVRSTLVVAIICLVILAIILLKQGKTTQATILGGGGFVLFSCVFAWAISMGGNETLNRVLSLTQSDAGITYGQNRGYFLASTIQELLPQYPWGAGLCRWGPMNGYFGDPNNPLNQTLWVEIQWTGWLFDGGIPLIVAYVIALYLITQSVWKIAMDKKMGALCFWAAIILAYDVGAFATLFGYPLFIGQGGMEFWFLNSALYMTAWNSQQLTKK